MLQPLRTTTVMVMVAAIALIAAAAMTSTARPHDLLTAAEYNFKNQNWADAAAEYERLLEAAPDHPRWQHASERIIDCHLRLEQFNEALEAAYRHLERCEGSYLEARARRLLGNLYMTLPKWGTRAGGEFHRGQWRQGMRVVSYRHDRNKAIAHLERARELYARYAEAPEGDDPMPAADREGWAEERIEALFDLASACSRFGIYENQPFFWFFWWGERDDTLAETAGQSDFDEYHSMWQYHRKRPLGLRIDAEGRPIFPTRPAQYGEGLDNDQKLLYLLHEVRRLDPTEEGRFTALSWLRQAGLARSRFGMDRLDSYTGQHAALKETVPEINPWELADSEAIILAGGRAMKVTLPETWDVMGLLAKVVRDYPDSGVADEALYTRGLYHQSRQQYTAAIETYRNLTETFPQSDRTGHARSHISRIQRPEAMISPAAVQLPDGSATLQVSYRNTDRLWFIARPLDVEGLLHDLRTMDLDDERQSHHHWHWSLHDWHNRLTHRVHRDDHPWHKTQVIAAEHVGAEALRWSEAVEDDGTHRYAEVELPLPVRNRGGYIIYAYVSEPAEADAEVTGTPLFDLGTSRAVYDLQDVALVEKQTDRGRLYLIADAATGAPMPGAEVEILETWTTWEQNKSVIHRRFHNLRTDDSGLALLEASRGGVNRHLHVLVKAGDGRLAWSGMQYGQRYSPSGIRDSIMAYMLTDRPVYRPGQEVRFKVWLRQMREGQLHNLPNRSMQITIRDARGNTVHEVRRHSDEFGGLDGQFTLSEEATLGVYTMLIPGVGSRQFRVEEYRKPEFEVTVEPGTDHAKLGEKVTATVRADYYFGAPVSEGEVTYRIYREEYRHRYYFPSRWDWLYGPGYGLPWYESEWFPWWSRIRSCFVPPPWWWYGRPFEPVRELVAQGEARLDEQGRLEVEIDTGPALAQHGDQDHRYTIEAEVRDASRRVVSGSGQVAVTRQAWFAMIQPGRGHYRPGEEMRIRIRLLTPDNRPVQTTGTVTVSELQFARGDNPQLSETELDRWQVESDARGHIELQLRHEKSGQLKVHFKAEDAWGGTVENVATVWVIGRDFEGRFHRFNDLELITDQRTYQPGDTARIMLNTAQPDSHVLLATEVDNRHLIEYRMVHVPEHSKVIELPITERHAPNFFIEALTIHQARTHEQMLQINVPPEDAVMDVTIQTDKPRYEPGEEATLTVTATGPDGEPARAQFALSTFDRSLLYIADETAPSIARFFHGNLRHHHTVTQSNLYGLLSARGNLGHPHRSLRPLPQAWHGVWGPMGQDWRIAGLGDLGIAQRLAGGAPGAGFDARMRMDAPLARAAADDADGFAVGQLQDLAEAQAPTAAPVFAEAELRTDFADSALWLATLTTDSDGRATHSFTWPQNLTTWKLNAWGITTDTRVGQAEAQAITSKDLLVRLAAPRHFVERDEVVLSANVHNYLESDKTARVSIEFDGEVLELIEGDGRTPAELDIEVPANSQRRIEWRVRVLRSGEAAITVTALTDEESDAMRMTFPAIVYGGMRHVAHTGMVRPDEDDRTVTLAIDLPEQRKPELSRLEVQVAPSLIGAMMDALPYTLDYPYGCTEQTMSRFLPAVLTLQTLNNMGIELEDVQKIRGRLEEVRRMEQDRHWRVHTYADSPIFDTAELEAIIAASLVRIASQKNNDGGWGWWGGSSSTAYLTSYVLFALISAEDADVEVDRAMIDSGLRFLQNTLVQRMRARGAQWRPHTVDTFGAYVLSMRQRKAVFDAGDLELGGDLLERLWNMRGHLTPYGKSLLALALANHGEDRRAGIAVENVLQYLVDTPRTHSAHVRVPRAGWWYWWNNDIETNAWALRAIVRVDPDSEVAPRIVRWLLNNRRNGYYWSSTRDTTICIAAMSAFIAATGEAEPDMKVTISYDGGRSEKTVRIDKDNFFTFDNTFILEGHALGTGPRELTIRKQGRGALYYSTYLRYFTQEDTIEASGHQLEVERSYYRLEQMPFEVEVEDATGRPITEQRLRYQRVPVIDGDAVKSGDIIQVELKVTTDNHYTFLAIEDMKPAGFEPVALTSGMTFQEGFWAYQEVRDRKTCYFIEDLDQGSHLLRYRLRAETPGIFHALPTQVHGMYAPELRANAASQVIRIVD